MPESLQDLARIPDFFNLSEAGQIEVIKRMDADFATMSGEAQVMVLGRLREASEAERADPTPSKTFTESAVEAAPKILGGVALGLATGGTSIPVIAGAVAVGAGGGEALRQVGQHVAGDPDAPRTSLEAAKGIGGAALEEGLGELAGGYVIRGVAKVLAPFAKKITPEARRVMDAFGKKLRPFLTPAEATESQALDIMENIGDKSLIGGGKFAEFRLRRGKVLDDVADDLIDQFGERVTPDQFGEIFVAAVNNKRATVKPVEDMLYNNVRQMVGGTEEALVPTASLKRFAEPLTGVAEELGGIEASMAGDDLLSAVMDLPDTLSFDAALDLRSRLAAKVREMSIINKSAPAVGKTKKIISLIDGEIEGMLKGIDPMPKEGRRFYRGTGGGRVPQYYQGPEDSFFAATTREEALQYGPNIEEIVARPNSKILEEGSDEFKSVLDEAIKDQREWAKQELVDTGDDMSIEELIGEPDMMDPVWVGSVIDTAKSRGYDMVLFDEEVGSIILNESAFIRDAANRKGDALTAWRIANSFYKQNQAKFNNKLVRRMLKRAEDTGMGPQTIGKQFFKPNNLPAIKQLKTIISPSEFQTSQGFFMQHLFERAVDTEGNIMGKKLLNLIQGKTTSFGLPMMKEIFSKQQLNALTTFGEALKLTQGRQAAGLGSMFVQLSQAGAAVSIITGKGLRDKASAVILIVPALMSRAMLNPKVAKLLKQGLALPRGSERAGGIMARLTAELLRIQHEKSMEEEDTAAERPILSRTEPPPPTNMATEFIPF